MLVKDLPLGRFVAPSSAAAALSVPGVVFIHDVWGPSEHSRHFSERLASFGFGVLAPDFYRALPDRRIDDPGRWMRQLSDPRLLADVAEAIACLGEQPSTAGRRVGVVGVCMGGSYALLAACGVPGLAAAASFYGILSHSHGLLHDPMGLDPALKPREPLAAAADLACPLLALFGEDDPFVPLTDVRALEERLAAVEVESEVVVYPGAGHAFMNETRADAHRPEAAADAWRRLADFFHRHLDSPL